MSERGWRHPIACINTHDEDGNCLDGDGYIVGWPDVSTDRAARITVTLVFNGSPMAPIQATVRDGDTLTIIQPVELVFGQAPTLLGGTPLDMTL